MKIAFIGGGAMGEAMLSAVLGRGVSTAQEISVGEIDQARCQHLEHGYGVVAIGDNRLAAERGEVVVLAIKPQNLAAIMADLRGQFKSGQLVLSIVAGARLNTLSLGLDHGAIVRVMPNTPARIGRGISVWTSTEEVSSQQREWTVSIFGAMGGEIYVDDEKYIDMATAISGSGPAYFFYMVESLVAAAIDIGLPQDVAQELVLQTMIGSGHLLKESGMTPADLRKMVTSPGGTTAVAIKRFEEGGFAEMVKKAVHAAYERAKELGG